MKIFVAGASGVIGSRLVPALVTAGHEVVGMTRSSGKADALARSGADPVVADALDRDAVEEAVVRAAPQVVVHQLTDLRRLRSFRRLDDELETTNLLRTRGTDNLLSAARAAGAKHFIAQSYGLWIYERVGAPVKDEDDRLDPEPPRHQRRSLDAIRHLERVVAEAEDLRGLVLRYGNLYGPGTAIGQGGAVAELVRRRGFPIVGSGAGVWSFVHVDDAVLAALKALTTTASGIYNIADDEPAPVTEWLPELARVLGAKPPRRVPAWIGRLASGEVGLSMMTRIRGMSNNRARRELGWRPAFASWRDGFRAVFAAAEREVPAATGSVSTGTP